MRFSNKSRNESSAESSERQRRPRSSTADAEKRQIIKIKQIADPHTCASPRNNNVFFIYWPSNLFCLSLNSYCANRAVRSVRAKYSSAKHATIDNRHSYTDRSFPNGQFYSFVRAFFSSLIIFLFVRCPLAGPNVAFSVVFC